MTRLSYLLGGSALVFSSAIALAQASPQTAPPPTQSPPTPTPTQTQTQAPDQVSEPVVQDISPRRPSSGFVLPSNLPSLAELEAMSDDEFEQVFGLKPRVDIPAASRRSLRAVGVLGEGEGGLRAATLGPQPASLVRAALAGNQGRLVSRWGHILLRRALASRMAAPDGMDPVDFAALRAALLVRMGEGAVARALVQQVDNGAYNTALTSAAFDAFVATGDIAGACPMLSIVRTYDDEDPRIRVTRDICDAFSGRSRDGLRRLDRASRNGVLPRGEMLLALRYAGAGGEVRRAVTVEWDEFEGLTPFAYALATATGLEVPDTLRDGAGRYYAMVDATGPAIPLETRAESAFFAGANGVLSSQAMVDLYSLGYAEETGSTLAERAEQLRLAYVASSPADRLAAMQSLWNLDTDAPYGARVLTAYAAARLPVIGDADDAADDLVSSMLAAGLDRNALRWADEVDDGSPAWAMIALADPSGGQVDNGDVDSFSDDDDSVGGRRTRLLVAGLAGLGRADDGMARDYDIDLTRETRWTRAISGAAAANSEALVALLAGLGMQGDSWARMTPLHLYHIVRALDRVGLSAEARMIAAEAVARG